MSELMDTTQTNWKQRLLLTGTLIGAALGFVSAYLLARTAEESGGELKINTADILRMSLAVITTIRGVAALGSGNNAS